MSKTTPKWERRTEVRQLDVDLTSDEVEQKAKRLAEKVQEAEAVEDEKKRVVSSFKARADEIAEEVKTLARRVKTRREPRPVECAWQPSPSDLMACLHRFDTGEEIERRPMSHEERQPYLPGTEARKEVES